MFELTYCFYSVGAEPILCAAMLRKPLRTVAHHRQRPKTRQLGHRCGFDGCGLEKENGRRPWS